MGYFRTNWLDRIVQYPNRWLDELNNVKTFTPNPGTVTEAGTYVNASRMNSINDGIEQQSLVNMVTNNGFTKSTEFDRTITNSALNGNFSSTANWSQDNATGAVSSNVYSMTGNGTAASPFMYQTTSTNIIDGNRYYIRVRVRVTNSICQSLRLGYAGTGVVIFFATQALPVINTWYTLHGIVNVPSTSVGVLKLYIFSDYLTAGASNAQVMQVDGANDNGVMAIKMNNEAFVDWSINQISTLFNKHFTTRVLEVIETTKLTNHVKNSKFSGTSNWSPIASTLSATGNILSVAGDGSQFYVAFGQSVTNLIGKKAFIKTKVRVTNSSCLKLLAYILTPTYRSVYEINNPTINQWYDPYFFVESLSTDIAYDFIIRADYVNSATASGKIMQLDGTNKSEVKTIAVTGTRYVNNSLEQMNTLLSDDVFASMILESDKPTSGDITQTTVCNNLGLYNEAVTDFDTIIAETVRSVE